VKAEIYRDIEGYEAYQVSNTGKVKSLNHNKEIILKAAITADGYVYVNLYKDKTAKTIYVHHLVANAFLPKEEGRDYIDHLDNDRLNNNIENLKRVTKRENCQNLKMNKEGSTSSKFVGVSYVKKGRKNWRAQIRMEGKNKELGTFLTQEEAAKRYDLKLIELGEQPVNFSLSEYQ